MNLTTKVVEAKSEQIKINWTKEMVKDFELTHGIDAELELTKILTEQIAIEMNTPEYKKEVALAEKLKNFYY